MSTDLGNAAYTVKEIALPREYVVRPEDLGHVRAVIDNFSEAIFNPSTIDRLAHTILACWITGAFVVVGISAWWLLRNRHFESARSSIKIGLAVATVACLLQMVAGDSTARGVANHQPTKLAALEGLEQSQRRAPLGIVGWASWKRDAAGQIIGVEEKSIRIPGMLSILVSGDFLHPGAAAATEVKGLAQLPSDELLRARHPGVSDTELARIRPKYWPNVPVLFQTYHLMIGLGVFMTLAALLGCGWWWTRALWNTHSKRVRVFLRVLVVCPFLAQLATQAGWFTAEMGRQPWIVYEVLKTGDAVSAAIRAPQVLTSIILFTLIYVLLTILFVTLLAQKIKHGPTPVSEGETIPDKRHALSLRSGRQTRE
jgi:cytochrome d ubiquinol oxidase subunit I